jgi:hypothetical protein
MDTLISFLALTIFPGGLFILVAGLAYEWANHKTRKALLSAVARRALAPDEAIPNMLENN